MPIYRACMPQFRQMLVNLRAWLGLAARFVAERGLEEGALLSARLADDQFPFVKQVQVACDVAKLTAARLTAKPAPKHEDTENTLEELERRIDGTIAFLDTLAPGDFDVAAERKIVLPFMPTRASLGENYLHEFALPNFYFHLVTAYSILRNQGVPLGKQDYIGRLTTEPAA